LFNYSGLNWGIKIPHLHSDEEDCLRNHPPIQPIISYGIIQTPTRIFSREPKQNQFGLELWNWEKSGSL
jgi:hypothetical protein